MPKIINLNLVDVIDISHHWKHPLNRTLNISLSNNSLSMRTDLITFIVFSILAHLDGIRNYVIFRSKVQCVTRFDRRILWNILTFYTATTTLIISVVKSFLLAYFFRKYFLLCSVQWEHYFVVKYLYIVCTIYRATRKGLPVIQVI